MTEKATTPEEPTPTTPVKGIAHWSLTPEDNANVDAKINWAEGMLPSAVNNSARMMMTRIREQYDIDQGGGGSGNIRNITADKYAVVSLTGPGLWGINFIFTDKLTEAQYANYKAGKLQLLVNLVAPKIIDDVNYKRLSYNSVISINLIFKIGTNTYTHAMQFRLSFFGIEQTNTVINYHELKYFVNNTTLQVGGNNITTNYYALPMEKTYWGSKQMELKNPDGAPIAALTLTRRWYYISPMELILTDTINNDSYIESSIGSYALLPVGRDGYALLSIVTFSDDVVYAPLRVGDITLTTTTSSAIIKYFVTISPGKPRSVYGRVALYLNGPADTFTEYPMILTPTATNPYPLPV